MGIVYPREEWWPLLSADEKHEIQVCRNAQERLQRERDEKIAAIKAEYEPVIKRHKIRAASIMNLAKQRLATKRIKEYKTG